MRLSSVADFNVSKKVHEQKFPGIQLFWTTYLGLFFLIHLYLSNCIEQLPRQFVGFGNVITCLIFEHYVFENGVYDRQTV